jgi:hypothetical protein
MNGRHFVRFLPVDCSNIALSLTIAESAKLSAGRKQSTWTCSRHVGLVPSGMAMWNAGDAPGSVLIRRLSVYAWLLKRSPFGFSVSGNRHSN